MKDKNETMKKDRNVTEMKNKNVTKWCFLVALLLFVAATFHIADDKYLLGVVFFAAAVCFSSVANVYRKKAEEEEKTKGDLAENEEAEKIDPGK